MYIIKPHHIKSRPVTTKEDYALAHSLAKPMAKLCHKLSRGNRTAYAVAHCQITDKDPLRFFVTRSGMVYINPVIISSSDKITHAESCLSFPKHKQIVVERFYSLIVSIDGVKSFKNGIQACMIQHEIEHFDGKNIYNE